MDNVPQSIEPSEADAHSEADSSELPPLAETRSSLLFGHTPKEAIEVAAKLAIALSALAYASGLLIVNVYLSSVGTAYVGLPHVHYMMVGIVYGILLMFGCAPWLICRRFYVMSRGNLHDLRDKIVTSAITGAIVIVFLFLFANALIVISWRAIDYRHPSTLGPMGILLGIGLVSIGGIFVYYRKDALSLPIEVAPTQHLNVGLGVLSNLAMHLSYIILYASTIYPAISPTFGGGKLQEIVIVSKAEDLETFKSFGFEIDSGARRVGPVQMILEFDKFILLAPPDKKNRTSKEPKAIRIREDMVESILYLKGRDEKN